MKHYTQVMALHLAALLITTSFASANQDTPHTTDQENTQQSLFNDADFERFMAEIQEPTATESTPFDSRDTYLDDTLVAHLVESAHPRIKIIIDRLLLAKSATKSVRSLLTIDKLLLVGPPGVGKSDIAKAIAQIVGRPFIFLKSSLMATEYQNSGAQNLKRIIDAVKAYAKPCVVILDEIYSLIDKKKNDQKSDQDTAVALWQLIDECSQDKNILFIGTTNSLKDIPEALKSRFSNHIVEIELPDAAMRKHIISFYAQECTSKELLETIIRKTNGFSARELKELINEMRACAAMRNEESPIGQDLYAALQEIARCKKLFETPFKDKALELLKSHGLSIASLSVSILSVCLQCKNFLGSKT